MSESRFPPVELGEVLVQDTAYVTELEPRAYKKLSVRLYGRGVVLDRPVLAATLKMERHQLAKAGQLILSEIWGKKGALGIVPPEGEEALVTSHFFLFDINEDRLSRDYLKWIVRSNLLATQLGREARGTTGYAAVRPRHLLAAAIPLPPVEEQRRVVARIEALTDRIEETRGLLAAASGQTEALIASVHRAASGTRIVPLGDVIELHEIQEPIAPGVEYPLVGMRAYGQGLFARPVVDGAQTTYRVFNRIYPGALLLSQVKGWEGAVAVCPLTLAGRYASPEYRTFRCIPGRAVPEYLAVLVSSPWFWTRLRTLTRGVGGRRERIRPELFLNLQLPMPSVERQGELLPVLQKVEAAQQCRPSVAAALDALLLSVLHRAFSGAL